MIGTDVVGPALGWFSEHECSAGAADHIATWIAERNTWLESQGIGGIVKDGVNRPGFPVQWLIDAKFWFHDPQQELVFVIRFSRPT